SKLKPVDFGPGPKPLRTPAPGLDAKGRLWVSSAEGLFLRGPDGRFQLQPTPEIESLAYATPVFVRHSGDLLLGAESGLYVRSSDEPARWSRMPGAAEVRVLDLAEDGSGRLYVATAHGLYVRDETSQWSVIAEEQGLPSESCSALALEGERLWIGTWNGLCVLDRGE